MEDKESEQGASSSFEQALAELEHIIEQLQHPDLPLDAAVELYRRGTELAQQSEQLLSRSELQVKQLTQAVRERFEEYATESLDSSIENQVG